MSLSGADRRHGLVVRALPHNCLDFTHDPIQAWTTHGTPHFLKHLSNSLASSSRKWGCSSKNKASVCRASCSRTASSRCCLATSLTLPSLSLWWPKLQQSLCLHKLVHGIWPLGFAVAVGTLLLSHLCRQKRNVEGEKTHRGGAQISNDPCFGVSWGAGSWLWGLAWLCLLIWNSSLQSTPSPLVLLSPYFPLCHVPVSLSAQMLLGIWVSSRLLPAECSPAVVLQTAGWEAQSHISNVDPQVGSDMGGLHRWEHSGPGHKDYNSG